MTKRVAAVVLAGVLTMLCGTGVVAAGAVLNAAQGRYPGAVRYADDQFDLAAIMAGTVRRQAEYWTADELATVKNWYMERLHLAPSTTVAAASGGCLMLTQADLLYRFEHTLAVVICALPQGTQVVVNEKVALLP